MQARNFGANFARFVRMSSSATTRAASASAVKALPSCQAIRIEEFGGPEVLKAQTVPLRDLQAGEVAVAIRAFGVNPVDTYIRTGNYPSKPVLPYTPGSDCAGVVIAVGDGVSDVKEGDRVFTSASLTGSYATAGIFSRKGVHKLPSSFSYLEGAAIGVGHSTAYRALIQKGCARPGQWVLILGASGGVGTAAVEFAKWRGCNIIGTAGNDAGFDQLRAMGLSCLINHNTDDFVAKTLEYTGGRGADVIVDVAGHTNLAKDLKAVCKGGRVVIVGSRGDITVSPRDIMSRECIVTGVQLRLASPEESCEIDAAMQAVFALGLGRPVVGKVFSGLASAPEAHVETISRASGLPGRVVVDVSEGTLE